MKFLTQGIVFSEIPDEITLELGITNCPFNCEGCHSPFLQSDVGEILDENIIHNSSTSFGKPPENNIQLIPLFLLISLCTTFSSKISPISDCKKGL